MTNETFAINADQTAMIKTIVTTTTVEIPIVKNGDFKIGKTYTCVWVNPKAKKGHDGKPRFTIGKTYTCIRNASSTSETSGRPPVFLVDDGFAAVNCGADAKMKTKFIAN